MSGTSFGYTSLTLNASQLINLKENPAEIFSVASDSVIIPHRIAVRYVFATTPYLCENTQLKIKLGNMTFGMLPSSDFLDSSSDKFVLINIQDTHATEMVEALGVSLLLANDGTLNLSAGDGELQINTWYSTLDIN